jgi:glycosyltransferase involved in cell wall biosynthesis
MKRVGIIVRANERGLGTQTRAAWQNYPFDATLLVLDGNRRAQEHPEWYPDAFKVRYDPVIHEFEDWNQVSAFLDEVDVVFSVETLYDWTLASVGRGIDVKTVVQGNPELYGHNEDPKRHHPDRWTWPTTWLTDKLPPGPVVPVPVPTDCWAEAASPDEPLTVVHVGGFRANEDRNGTKLFIESLPFLNGSNPVRVRIYSQDGTLPSLPRVPPNVDVELYENGVLDRWAMYEGAHVLVMPRKYGGLCLPVQEAMTAGLAVLMTDCPPNPQTWPIKGIPAGRGRLVRTPGGNIMTAVANSRLIGHALLRLEAQREGLEALMAGSRKWAEEHTWEKLKPMYDDLFQSW